jgi:hypothetical protein
MKRLLQRPASSGSCAAPICAETPRSEWLSNSAAFRSPASSASRMRAGVSARPSMKRRSIER